MHIRLKWSSNENAKSEIMKKKKKLKNYFSGRKYTRAFSLSLRGRSYVYANFSINWAMIQKTCATFQKELGYSHQIKAMSSLLLSDSVIRYTGHVVVISDASTVCPKTVPPATALYRNHIQSRSLKKCI